jgi:CDP-4-dehydro-6-deoxyglucose reductase, E1
VKNKTDMGVWIDHPLMKNNISRGDLDCLITYLEGDEPRLTQGENVLAFEEEWSAWLGVKHSVFVNSGSSANLITLAVLKQLYGEGEVIVPPLTWVSDIAACLHNGFKPIFVDINANTLGLDTGKTIAALNGRTKAVFLTHAQGFNALSQELLDELETRNIPLIEDVCESHGAKFNAHRLGSYGLMSNFSFYFAHHMSTIEGGMVCTNDSKIYQMLRMYRSHGMVREASDSILRQQYAEINSQLNPDFIFAFPAYNLRNTEIGAVLGRSQLKRLDANNLQRIQNHDLFISKLNPERFRTNFEMKGSCNYAFNIILNQPDIELRDGLERSMQAAGVEFRRGSAGGGNQLRQPYLRDFVKQCEWEQYLETEHIHFFGWYVGNFPGLSKDKITQLCDLLNST